MLKSKNEMINKILQKYIDIVEKHCKMTTDRSKSSRDLDRKSGLPYIGGRFYVFDGVEVLPVDQHSGFNSSGCREQ